jgi:hypothetical protein
MVLCARDTMLLRIVAIKVLPAPLATDESWLWVGAARRRMVRSFRARKNVTGETPMRMSFLCSWAAGWFGFGSASPHSSLHQPEAPPVPASEGNSPGPRSEASDDHLDALAAQICTTLAAWDVFKNTVRMGSSAAYTTMAAEMIVLRRLLEGDSGAPLVHEDEIDFDMPVAGI